MMEHVYIFGLEHDIALQGAYDVAITDAWIPKGYCNPHFPTQHDVPIIAVETSEPQDYYTLQLIKSFPCLYFTPHETLDQLQVIQVLRKNNTTPLTFDYDSYNDLAMIGYAANLPKLRLWLHENFARTMFENKDQATFHKAFLEELTIEDQTYYLYDTEDFLKFEDELFLNGSWNFINELMAQKPNHAVIRCFETKQPLCALLNLGTNHPPSDIEYEQQHAYQHIKVKHPNFVPLVPGIHSKLTFSLETMRGEPINLCQEAPPVLLKADIRKSMSDCITSYLEADNGEEVRLAQPLVINEGRYMYHVGLAHLSFSPKLFLNLTAEERTIHVSLHTPALPEILKRTMKCPEFVTSYEHLARSLSYASHGLVHVTLNLNRLCIKCATEDFKLTLQLSDKLMQLLGGDETVLEIGKDDYIFPKSIQLTPSEPVYVTSTLARHGLLRILPLVKAEDGMASFDFGRIDYFPMSVDVVNKLDLSLKSKSGEMIPIDNKMVATLVFKKVKERKRHEHYTC